MTTNIKDLANSIPNACVNWIRSCITASPKAAMVVGKTVLLVGSVMILAALFGRVGMIGANTLRAKSNLPATAKLAEVYPQYPTWLVPEGPVGYTVAGILVVIGMCIAIMAGDALKKTGASRGAQ